MKATVVILFLFKEEKGRVVSLLNTSSKQERSGGLIPVAGGDASSSRAQSTVLCGFAWRLA